MSDSFKVIRLVKYNVYGFVGCIICQSKGVFVLPKLVSVSGNCPFVERNFFETGTGCPICFTETEETIETTSRCGSDDFVCPNIGSGSKCGTCCCNL